MLIMKIDPRDVLFDLATMATVYDFDRRHPEKHIGELVMRLPKEKRDAIQGMTSEQLADDVRYVRDILKKDAS